MFSTNLTKTFCHFSIVWIHLKYLRAHIVRKPFRACFLDKSTKFNIIFIYFSARLGCICCDDFTFFGNSVFVMVVEQGQIRKYRQSPQKGRLNKLPSFVLYMNQSMNASRVIQSWNERKKMKTWFCHMTLCVSVLQFRYFFSSTPFHLLPTQVSVSCSF